MNINQHYGSKGYHHTDALYSKKNKTQCNISADRIGHNCQILDKIIYHTDKRKCRKCEISYNWQGNLKLKPTLPTKKHNEVQMISLKLITVPKLLEKKQKTEQQSYMSSRKK